MKWLADCRSVVSASAHRISGPGVGASVADEEYRNAGGLECSRLLPLWVGGTRLTVWHPCDWRKERSSPASTARNSKRRFRVDSGVKRANTPTQEGWRRKRERSRQREFMTAGADIRARHRDAGAVSGNSGWQAGGRNLSTRRPQRFLAEVESIGTSAKNARRRR